MESAADCVAEDPKYGEVMSVEAAMKKLTPYVQPPIYQRVLLGMMQATDEILTQAGIPYWICYGVLIGAIRHRGFVPHDDDLDIECYESDVPRLQEAFEATSFPATFELSPEQRNRPMGKIIFFDCKTVQTTIDVFLRPANFDKLADGLSEAEVYPIERYEFNGILVNGPGGDPRGYLSRCYTQEVFNTVKVWNHHVDYLGDVDTCEFVAKSWALPLSLYNDAIAKLGYEAPTVLSTATETIEHFQREDGEVQKLLWDILGWASPLPAPSDAVWDGDE